MKPRILFLTHRVPYPPNRGDRIRTYHILKHLSARAHVWLGCLADEPVEDETYKALDELCEQIAIVPVESRLRWVRAAWSYGTGRSISAGAFQSPKLRRIVGQWSQDFNFDASLVSSSALTGYQQLRSLRHVPAFVDLIDVDSQKWLDYARDSTVPQKWILRSEGYRLRKLESGLSEWTQGLTVVSEDEADIYRSFCPQGSIEVISNGVDLEYFTPTVPYSGESGCLFLGALDYKPNVDGIVWFCHEIWPRIHERHPGQKMRLVGREPVPAVRNLSELTGVEVIGAVPDVRPWLRQAAVAVVPLRIARGVQNKVLESMAMGKAIVSSPGPLLGLGIQAGIHALPAESTGAWVEQISTLLNDRERREELGAAGLAYVTSNHRWSHCLSPLMTFLDLSTAHQHDNQTSRSAHPRSESPETVTA